MHACDDDRMYVLYRSTQVQVRKLIKIASMLAGQREDLAPPCLRSCTKQPYKVLPLVSLTIVSPSKNGSAARMNF